MNSSFFFEFTWYYQQEEYGLYRKKFLVANLDLLCSAYGIWDITRLYQYGLFDASYYYYWIVELGEVVERYFTPLLYTWMPLISILLRLGGSYVDFYIW